MEATTPARAKSRRRRLGALAVLLVLLVGLLAWFGRDAAPTRAEPTTPQPTSASPTIHDSSVAEKPRRATKAEPNDAPKPDASARRETPRTTHSLRVTVVAAADARPVEGALVIVGERSVRDVGLAVHGTTGADGTVALQADPKAGERVTVRNVGFVTARRHMTKGAPDEIRVELTAGVPLHGRVVFADSRAPAAGVPVRAWATETRGLNDDAEVDVARVTDEDGRFDLAGVPIGKPVRVYAAKPGYRTADALVVRERPGDEVELVLGDGGVLEGFVYDVDGKPLAEVDVLLLRPDMDIPDPSWAGSDATFSNWAIQGFGFPPTRTDSAGRYEFKGVRLPIDGVPQPRLAAARDAKGRSAKSEPATFTRHAERMQRDVRFTAACSITVRVTWKSPPPDGFRVRAQRGGPGNRSDTTRKLAGGASSTTFEGLREGLYFVSVSTGDEMRDGIRTMREVTLKDGEQAVVSFAPDGDRRIEGVVVDAEGKPVPDVVLKFETGDQTAEGDFEVRATTRADGAFAFEHLAPAAGRIEFDRQMTEMNGAFDALHASPEAREVAQLAALRLRDVAPGGPALRIVIQRGARITGRLVPAPKSRDRVQFSSVADDDWEIGALTLSDDGKFAAPLPVVGRPVDFYFKSDGFAPLVFVDRTVAPGATLDVGEIKLERGLAFEGRLRDAAGLPLANANVYLTDPWLGHSVDSDAEGTFRLDGLPRRPVHLSVHATKRAASWRITIDPAAGTGTFTVGDDVVVAGRVLDAAGEPARKVDIRFLPSDAGRMEHAGAAYLTTDADGRFDVRVAPGRFRVEVRRREYVPVATPTSVEIKDGENPPLDLRLR